MKKNIALIAIAVSICGLTSCNNSEGQIRKSAQGYLDALANYKPAEARSYATEATCNTTLDFYEKIVAVTDQAVYADNIPATVTLGDITIDDTAAIVSYHKHTPSTEQDGFIHCVKRDGHWLVNEVIQVPGLTLPEKAPRNNEETVSK